MPAMMCPYCNYLIVNPSQPCPSCGAEMPASAVPPPPVEPRPPYRGQDQYNDDDSHEGISKRMIAAILCAVILVLTGGVGCYYYIRQGKNDLTNNPSIERVRNAISGIESISTIEIVTEHNDPNRQLGEKGGYTGCLFFKSSLVISNYTTEFFTQLQHNESAIEAGTDGGGSIEVYANKSDAKKRNAYLAGFDGSTFSSGSHKILGTLVIRTSNKLTASQQAELETKIINALLTGSSNSQKMASHASKQKPPMVSNSAATQAPQPQRVIMPAFDLQETRGRIRYSVSSSWRKRVNNDWIYYYPYEENTNGYLAVMAASVASSPTVDSVREDALNANLDGVIEGMRHSESVYDFKLPARTDLNGIPVQGYESKQNISGNVYFVQGFALVYGNYVYTLSVCFPETGDSQFFSSALSQVRDSLTIREYTQAELSRTTANTSTVKPTVAPGRTSQQSADSAYQVILDEYSKRIRAATPRLINEYNAEAARNRAGLEGLAQISNAKVEKLAEISNDGVSKMANVMMSSGSGKYDVYQEWAGKLMDVYMEEAGKITNAYMSSILR